MDINQGGGFMIIQFVFGYDCVIDVVVFYFVFDCIGMLGGLDIWQVGFDEFLGVVGIIINFGELVNF